MKINIATLKENFVFEKSCLEKINATLDSLVNNEFGSSGLQIDNRDNNLANIIAQLCIGSKRVRAGNYPSQFCFNSILNLIEKKISANEPIPLIVPMGPHKTVINENIDLAEIYALKTLSSLNLKICKYYPKGLIFYLREEDITGWFLTGTNKEVRQNIEQYLNGFERLTRVLGYEKFIIPFRESDLIEYKDIVASIDIYSNPIRSYLNDTKEVLDNNYQNYTSYKALKELGWKGNIPIEQRNFYRERYKRHYPEKSMQEIEEMIVNYLAISFAKSQLSALAPKEINNEFIQLTFAPQIPGIPQDIVSRRLYYRTLPTNISRMHLPFWRAKGFLTLDKDVNFALSNWNTKQLFYKQKVKLTRNNESVVLSADITSETHH